jgi:predicted acylesterase/phospholipase RssA
VPVALLISGGGARGAVQVRTIEGVRDELGRPPDLVAGVSVGSLAALLVGQDRIKRLRKLWENVARRGSSWFQHVAIDFDPIDGIFTLRPLRRRVEAEIDHPLVTVTRAGLVVLRGKRYHSALLNGLTLAECANALIASSTQPGIHEEAWWRGRKAADGGLKHVIPAPPELDSTTTLDLSEWTVHVVLATPADRDHPVPEGEEVNAASRGLECLIDNVVARDLDRLDVMVAAGATVHLYSPPEWPGATFDASQKTIEWRLGELGEAAWTSGVVLGTEAGTKARART